jgi:beta-galactosidase beta subunit
MFAVVDTSFPKLVVEQKLETHKKYIDVYSTLSKVVIL